jgi:hypothetical protein
MKKTLFTLNIDNYQPDITALTYPLMKMYAHKIGADFAVIDKRKLTLPGENMAGGFPGLEKFQIYELGKEMQNDWNIFIDPDALVHPDFFDPTAFLPKDTTAAYSSSDFVPIRFRADKYFMRDGRMIGKGNWFSVVSDWCLDYYHPLDDITLAEAQAMCFPMHDELTAPKPMSGYNMVEDMLVSRNIARYGLKHVLMPDILAKFGLNLNYINLGQIQTPQGMMNQFGGPLFHTYLPTPEQKVVQMQQQLKQWGIEINPKPIVIPGEIKETAAVEVKA